MKKEIITFKEPKSPISEIFRNLRTNIQFANTKRGLHSILITSTSPSEGKSWVSANLAVAFAQAGRKVILVDCDMRKGRQFSIFGVSPTPGLSNYLSGINSDGKESDSNILSYIKETEVENLFLITAGNIPPNPSELLVSEQMADTMEQLKTICDLVIFDGTPSTLVTDAVIISRYVDTTLIVSAYKTTKMDDLEKVKRDIENVGGRIAGVVINKVPISQKQYYSTYYYGSTKDSTRTKLQVNSSRKSEEIKRDEQTEIDRKRLELKEKSRNIIEQNRMQEKRMQEKKIQEKKETTSKIFDYESQDDENDKLSSSEELLKQMNQYITDEKNRLKGDN